MPAPTEESDEQLVERANRGDADAFETLYLRHRDWVASLAYRFTSDREEALEVLQETFAYFFAKFPGFGLTASLRTFLYPTVKHMCIDRLRRLHTTVAAEEIVDELPHAPGIEPGAGLGLTRALGELPAAQREVVLLRFIDDLSLVQIAEAVDAPVGTVKSRLHHAVEALRARLRVKKPKND